MDTVQYNIKEKDVFIQYDCMNTSNVIIIGKGDGYGTINITREGCDSLKTLEIRHVGKVLIDGKSATKTKVAVLISSCDELRSSSESKWGETVVFESIKKVYLGRITYNTENYQPTVSIGRH